MDYLKNKEYDEADAKSIESYSQNLIDKTFQEVLNEDLEGKKTYAKKYTKKTKITIKSKKFKKKKKLYVKVRAYKLNGKKKVFGKGSKAKKVKK